MCNLTCFMYPILLYSSTVFSNFEISSTYKQKNVDIKSYDIRIESKKVNEIIEKKDSETSRKRTILYNIYGSKDYFLKFTTTYSIWRIYSYRISLERYFQHLSNDAKIGLDPRGWSKCLCNAMYRWRDGFSLLHVFEVSTRKLVQHLLFLDISRSWSLNLDISRSGPLNVDISMYEGLGRLKDLNYFKFNLTKIKHFNFIFQTICLTFSVVDCSALLLNRKTYTTYIKIRKQINRNFSWRVRTYSWI